MPALIFEEAYIDSDSSGSQLRSECGVPCAPNKARFTEQGHSCISGYVTLLINNSLPQILFPSNLFYCGQCLPKRSRSHVAEETLPLLGPQDS